MIRTFTIIALLLFGSSAFGAVPVIFNASSNAQPGDIVSIQGTNFDGTSQVWLGGAGGSSPVQLAIVNTVGTQWIAAQTPSSWSPGAMVLWIVNSSGSSSMVNLNGAIPFNLDALQIVPSGAFRVLGRNLMMAGHTPLVTVEGLSATVNVGASTVNMLVVTAPSGITATSGAAITVDNGNGTGAVTLSLPYNRAIAVVPGQSGDPFSLGVGWAAGFSAFSGTVNTVSTPCNGGNDTAAIQAAINAVSGAGAVLLLPAGTCVLTSALTMKSDVVLEGASQTTTTIEYNSNFPIYATGLDLVGLRNLTIVNQNSTVEGPLITFTRSAHHVRVRAIFGRLVRRLPVFEDAPSR